MLIRPSLLAASLLFVASYSMNLPAQSPFVLGAGEKAISFKRVNDLGIALTNDSGKFSAGENSFCLVVRDQKTMTPVAVQSVRVDFRQLVGRMQEEPITPRLTDKVGRFCGTVDLGRQYYSAASYYAFVYFTDPHGKKRKARFFLTVK